MSKLYGNMNAAEINETARNLRENMEFDMIRALGAENGIDDKILQEFIDGETEFLLPESAPEEVKPDPELSTAPNEESAAPNKESASEKLQRELAGTNDSRIPIKPIVVHLIGLCREDNAFEQKVLQGHKTLKKCCDYVYEQARQKLNGRSGYLEDDVVYKMAGDYYRLDDAEIERKKAEEAKKAAEAREKAESERKAKKEAEKKQAKKEKANDDEEQISLF